MEKRRFLVRVAVANALVMALVAVGAWRWVAWRTAPAKTAAPAVAALADGAGAVKPLELVTAEVAARDAADLPGIWVTFNGDVSGTGVEAHLKLAHGRRELSAQVERRSPDGRKLLLRLANAFGDGDIIVRLDGGDAPLRLSRSVAVSVPAQMALLQLRADSPAQGDASLTLIFTRLPQKDGAASFISVEPALPFTVEHFDEWGYRQGLRLRGAFEPGKVYTVKVAQGLAAAGSEEILRKEVTRQVQVPDRRSLLAFADNGRYLSPQGGLTLAGRAVNVSRYKVSVARVPENNAIFFGLREDQRLPYHYGWHPSAAAAGLDDLLGEREYRLYGARNERQSFEIDLREVAPGIGTGIYLLTLDDPDNGSDERIVVISDLGVTARLAEKQVAVWVLSVAQGAPVSGAEVALWSVNNKALARGVSARGGVCQLTWAGDDEPFALTVKHGADATYLPLNNVHAVGFQQGGGERRFATADLEGLLTTDRGVYRPGETINAHVLVRDRQLNAPEPLPVVVRLRKPDGRVLSETGGSLDRFGALGHSFVLPYAAPTGVYTVEAGLPGKKGAVLANARVAVEDFAPPQLAVRLSGVAREALAASHKVVLQADYLFGRPAAGLNAGLTVTFEAVPFVPEGWQGWEFGDTDRSMAPEVVRMSGELDSGGSREFEILPSDKWRPAAALRQRVVGEVRDGNGRVVTTAGEGLVHIYPRYIGLRTSVSGNVEVARPFVIEAALVRPDGTPLRLDDHTPMAVKVMREVWTPVITRDDNQRLNYTMARELVAVEGDWSLRQSGGLGRLELSLPLAGQYRITVQEADGAIASSLAVTATTPGMSWWSWGGTRPDKLDLSWDKAAYEVGETATLLIKSPFPGAVLLSLEGRTVLQQQTLLMTGKVARVSIPVVDEYLPHVRCAVSVVRAAAPEEVWQAHRASGAVGLPLALPERELTVACSAPATVRPDQRLEIALRLTDARGVPCQGRIVVAAVDEGVLQLTKFKWASPLAWFLAPRQSGITGYDVFNELLPEREAKRAAGASHTAGDEAYEEAVLGQLSPVRGQRFKPLALWSGVLASDVEGKAVASFALPEFAGKLRIMALAYDEHGFGAAEAGVVVKRPFVLSTGLPRFLAPGDVCRLGVEVFNESGEPAAIALKVGADGPVEIADSPEATAKVIAGGVAQAAWQLRATAAVGLAHVRVELAAGEERFAETIELPVRPASGRVLRTSMGMLQGGETTELALPDGFLPDSVNWRVALSGRQEVRLAGALQELLDYPYGCLEQTVSRALPLVVLPDLAHRAIPGKLSGDETTALVNVAVTHILAMRGADGLYSMWGGGGDGWEWGTLYAAQFLAEAARAGYAVPVEELEATVATVERIINKGVGGQEVTSAAWQGEMALKAQAAVVLTILDKPPRGWLDRLFEVHRLLRRDAAAQVAQACARAGDARRARTILEFLGVPGHETRNGLNSEARTLALTLLAWCEIEPEGPVAMEIVRRLNGLRIRAGWGITQDNALAVLALGRYARLAAADKPFVARMKIADDEKTCTPDDNLVLHGKAMPEGGVTIANDGPGACYYFFAADGIPLEPQTGGVAAGLRVSRTFYDEQGAVISAAKLRVGDALIVRLTLVSDVNRDNLILADLLPAGLEVESADLGRRSSPAYWPHVEAERSMAWSWVARRDVRDDRILLFSGWVGEGSSYHFYYRARAVTAGTYVWPGLSAEAMYDPEVRGSGDACRLVVE